MESDGWKDAVPTPHEFHSTPISTNEQAPFTNGELKDLRTKVGEGFTHIVIPASRDWKIVQSGNSSRLGDKKAPSIPGLSAIWRTTVLTIASVLYIWSSKSGSSSQRP
jgi:hypothetical protein